VTKLDRPDLAKSPGPRLLPRALTPARTATGSPQSAVARPTGRRGWLRFVPWCSRFDVVLRSLLVIPAKAGLRPQDSKRERRSRPERRAPGAARV